MHKCHLSRNVSYDTGSLYPRSLVCVLCHYAGVRQNDGLDVVCGFLYTSAPSCGKCPPEHMLHRCLAALPKQARLWYNR